ncbi:hypothetical protein AB7M42_008790 [Bradyrhizobium diazoefficiens]
MKKASKELEQAFWDGIKQDREMHKHSRRLLKVLAENDGDVKKTIVQMVMAPKIQTGLKWAAENDVLQRSLEAMVIQFKDDFADVPNIDKVAKWRMELVAR